MMTSMMRIHLALFAVAMAGPTTHASALTVRVDSAGGAPRLVVNGQPVRGRMFWGGPGSAPIRISPEWQEVAFEFTARGSATDGTMQLRFGQEPCNVYLDDIHVTDLDGGTDLIAPTAFEGGPDSYKPDWTYWPTDGSKPAGTVEVTPGAGRGGSAALHVKLTEAAAGARYGFHVYHQQNLNITEGHRYRVSLWARSEPAGNLMIAFYKPGERFVPLGGPPDCFTS
ncbi:MAG: hypothetical protein M1457_11775, partial [bacterium]|nr:hypothetical protein [bacterium]